MAASGFISGVNLIGPLHSAPDAPLAYPGYLLRTATITHPTFGLIAVFNAMPCCGMLLAGGVRWCNIGETAWRVAATFLP